MPERPLQSPQLPDPDLDAFTRRRFWGALLDSRVKTQKAAGLDGISPEMLKQIGSAEAGLGLGPCPGEAGTQRNHGHPTSH